jgi:phospholipase/carboxylesterase
MSDALRSDRSLKAEINLYYDLYVPEGPDGPRPLLVALHGYGSSKRHMMRDARLMAPEGFAVACLQGPYQIMREPKEEGGPARFGFGWLTNFKPEESVALHHRTLRQLMEHLIDEGVADGERVFLLGFSQTCALNFKFAFTHPRHLRGVIGICGGIPGDWDTADHYKSIDAGVLYLSGSRDEFYTPERIATFPDQLRQRAREVTAKSYDAAHEMIQPMRDDVKAWLAERA